MPLVQDNDIKSPVAGGKWAKLKLSAIHDKLWGETKAGMLWAVPSFADIWLGMMIDKDGEQAHFTDQVETAATDDKYLYINMVWFFGLTLDERLFVATHEILHAMYGHAGQAYLLQKQGHIDYADGVRLPVDAELLNVAADYVINDQLIVAKIGTMPEKGLHWPALINGDMGVLDAYRLLHKEKKRSGGDPRQCKRTTKGGETQGPGSGQAFDKLIEPGKAQGKSTNKAISERNQGEWDVTIQAAMESAKLRGQLSANLARLFGKRLQPKADWRDLYQIAISKRVGNSKYSWNMLEPQLIYRGIGMPGRMTHGCNLVVIAADTSGSINQRTLDVFLAETCALMDQARPKRIIFAQCDACIHEWTEVYGTDELYHKELKGGGGTSFVPVFERIAAEGETPDLLVYLTDLEGDFPTAKPSYPVVWGSIYPEGKAPWGDIVFVPPQAEETGEI